MLSYFHNRKATRNVKRVIHKQGCFILHPSCTCVLFTLNYAMALLGSVPNLKETPIDKTRHYIWRPSSSRGSGQTLFWSHCVIQSKHKKTVSRFEPIALFVAWVSFFVFVIIRLHPEARPRGLVFYRTDIGSNFLQRDQRLLKKWGWIWGYFLAFLLPCGRRKVKKQYLKIK